MEHDLDRLRQAPLDTAPFRRIDGDWGGGLILLCDHAENRIPQAYGTLGLSAEDLGRHIAYDIGAAPVTEALALRLGVPALITSFSRLLIDPNRGLDDPTLVMQISDGVIVPGNLGLDRAELEARIRSYYAPYHDAIDLAIDSAIAAGRPPVLIAIHSFTQAWKSIPRPWHVGVLWDKDPRLARPLLQELQRLPGVVVGDNVPYSGQLKGDTLYRHGTKRGLAHALVELRQDLILSEDGQRDWAARLADVLGAVLAQSEAPPGLHAIERYGSHTDALKQGSG
jgi:predicted N-formylglutamate amidohydrolase